MKRKLLLFFSFFLLCLNLIEAQNKIIGSIISAEDNEPVVGASVLIKGTTIGTIADLNGNFSLTDVPNSAKTIVVSYIGMKTQEVAIKPVLKIILESDTKALDEVVVSAMGISRERKSLGYALQEVKSDELTKAGNSSLTSSLSGKIAGVQINQFGGTVGASSRISVRGNSSLNVDQQPLIVVDGVPISNDTQRSGDNTYSGVDYGSGLNDINPEDIESISVLKGGSAALYGMRAGNGVILITTKTGKNTKGVQVSYDMNLTFDRVTNIPKLQNSYGQGYDGDEFHWKRDYPDMTYQEYATAFGFDYSTGVNTGWDESWGPRLDAGLKISQYDSNGEYVDWVSNPNNVNDFFTTGATMNHVISVQSKSDKSTTRASLSYRDQKGTVPNTDQKRYGGQLNTNMKLNDYISFDMSASYTRTESDNLLQQGYSASNPINSLIAWSGRQINMKTLKDNWNQKDAAGNYTY